MLDEGSHEAFDRAHDRAVDHDDFFFLAFFVDAIGDKIGARVHLGVCAAVPDVIRYALSANPQTNAVLHRRLRGHGTGWGGWRWLDGPHPDRPATHLEDGKGRGLVSLDIYVQFGPSRRTLKMASGTCSSPPSGCWCPLSCARPVGGGPMGSDGVQVGARQGLHAPTCTRSVGRGQMGSERVRMGARQGLHAPTCTRSSHVQWMRSTPSTHRK